MSATTVTDATFKVEVLNSDLPVLVDFWAPWCGPCRQVSPVIDKIADEHGNQIKVVKINTDDNPATAQALGVSGLPTLMVFQGGERVAEATGALPRPRIMRDLVNPFIGS